MKLSFLIPALLVCPLLAQTPPTHISPKGAATGLGNSNNSIPFSWTPIAYQQVHDLASFSSTSPAVWTKMSLRMASGFANTAGKTIDVELYVADSPNSAVGANATFANNIVAASEVNVFTRKMVNLPTVPDNSWAVSFPFDNNFAFGGASNLSWRAIVWGNSNNNMLFTYPLDAWTGSGTSTRIGTYAGCMAATGTKAATMSASGLGLGANSTFTGNSYVVAGGLPAILTFGLSTTNYGAIPLPFDLGTLGAPGCMVTNDILATLSGVTLANANGSISQVVSIPANPAFAGAQFYTQYMFLDAGANSLGLFSTDGRAVKLGTPPGVTRIYGSSPTATSGSLGINFGMSVGFN